MGGSSSKVGPTRTTSKRRSVNNRAMLRQMVGTAVEMKYPMLLVPASAFVRMQKLEPHQVMRDRGQLVMWEPKLTNVFFLSHRK